MIRMRTMKGSRIAKMMGRRKGRFVLVLAMFTLAVVAVTASGLSEFKEDLPDEGVNFDCLYCHESSSGGGPRNHFGMDFEANDFTYTDALGAMDSDDDGFTNEEELTGKPVSNPGDPESYPDPEGTSNLILVFLLGVIITAIVGIVLIWRK
jgi:hypothetical protein